MRESLFLVRCLFKFLKFPKVVLVEISDEITKKCLRYDSFVGTIPVETLNKMNVFSK